MPAEITCPNGHRLGLDPQHEGKRVRCPRCQAEFVARFAAVQAEVPVAVPVRPSPPPPIPEGERVSPGLLREGESERPAPRRRWDDDDDRRPSARGGRPSDRDWERSRDSGRSLAGVRVALTCFWWQYLLFVLAVVLSLVLALVAMLFIDPMARRDMRGPAVILLLLLGLTGLVSLAGVVMAIVGGGFGAQAPRQSGCRGPALTVLILHGVVLLLFLLSLVLVIAVSARGRDAGPVVIVLALGLTGLVGLAAFVVFMVLLRSLARYLGDDRSARNAVLQMIFGIVTPVGGGLVVFLTGAILNAVRASPTVGAMIVLGMSVALVVAMVLIYLSIMGIIRRLHRQVD
jgi:hypothetical protein